VDIKLDALRQLAGKAPNAAHSQRSRSLAQRNRGAPYTKRTRAKTEYFGAAIGASLDVAPEGTDENSELLAPQNALRIAEKPTTRRARDTFQSR